MKIPWIKYWNIIKFDSLNWINLLSYECHELSYWNMIYKNILKWNKNNEKNVIKYSFCLIWWKIAEIRWKIWFESNKNNEKKCDKK